MRIGVAMLCTAVMVPGAMADEAPLPGGLYEITSRLELPHVERWAIDEDASLSRPRGARGDSAAGAERRTIRSGTAPPPRRCSRTAGWNTTSPARGARTPSAHAAYAITPGRFSGRIAMVLGAKNMTMTEVQDGLRMGDCESTVQR